MAKTGSRKGGSGKKVANSLVAVSSAAVLAVYAAGYTRTRAAAEKLEGQVEERRPAVPRPPLTVSPAADLPTAALAVPVVAAVPKLELPKAELPKAEQKADPKPTLVASAKAATPEAVRPEGASAPPAPVPVSAKAPAPVAAPVPDAPAVAAPAPAPDPYKAVVAAAAPPWKDGKYEGWGTCRHGDLQATIVIEGGRITSAAITQCLTRYSCDIIDKLPPQVIQRQSPEVSYISGATQSTDAYYWAIVSALGKAK
jgi:uncharacterized protein with FMN-binding domain